MKKITDDEYLANKMEHIVEHAEQVGAKTRGFINMILKGSVNVVKISTLGVVLLIISFFGGVLFSKSTTKVKL